MTSVLFVGRPRTEVAEAFASCTQVGELSNSAGVANEEVGTPLVACTGRTLAWAALWPRLKHLS